ncbi:MAG: M56 family metallopeptidase [bacterium]|nr:M56 family metallopeptidase [bacterium]
MFEIFKTILILSGLGFGLTAVLLCLKPITAKRLPAKWQYCVWIAVMLSMLIPFYKFIPAREVQRLPIITQTVQTEQPETSGENVPAVIIEDTPIEYREVSITPGHNIRLLDFAAYIWISGVCVFLLIVSISYAVYLARKRRESVLLESSDTLERVKEELNIKRVIMLKTSPEVISPMLVGVFFPAIYIPCREISDERMRMIFLHELTHYKRGDLLIKWLSVFVNALHWFNPLAYLLCANISESCEVSCDMSVTSILSDEERKIYMKTILDLVEEKE